MKKWNKPDEQSIHGLGTLRKQMRKNNEIPAIFSFRSTVDQNTWRFHPFLFFVLEELLTTGAQ